MYDLFTSAVLFFILVPGVAVTLPPGASIVVAGLVHALVFYVVQRWVAQYVPWWGIWVAAAVVLVVRFYMNRSVASTTYSGY
jgi:hypothetical protein